TRPPADPWPWRSPLLVDRSGLAWAAILAGEARGGNESGMARTTGTRCECRPVRGRVLLAEVCGAPRPIVFGIAGRSPGHFKRVSNPTVAPRDTFDLTSC